MKKNLLLLVFLSLAVTAYGQVKVTFSVDMSIYQKAGKFVPSSDTVRVAGDFNSWSTTANDLTKGAGADSLKYSAQISGVTAGAHAYKFIFIHSGTITWEDDPNRTFPNVAADTVLGTVFFNNITGKLNHVQFKVDMSLPIKQGKVNPTTDTVGVTGDFTGWGTSGPGSPTTYLRLTKGASDSVYSAYDTLHSGSALNFKFIYKTATGVNWEADPNRTYFVPEKDSSIMSDYWDRQNPNIQTGNGDVSFNLDMSVMVKCGIYNPAKDSVMISAGFNGWTTTDRTQFLAQNAIDDSSYFIKHTFSAEPYGAKPYKYVVVKTNPTGIDTIWKDGYERPVFWGGGNRMTLFQGTSTDTSDYYDGIHPDWFIPTGTNLQVKFSVDMTPAMNAALQAVPFVPAQDTLWWLSEEPAFARSQGWYRPSDGHMKILKMTRVGTTNIWSGTLAVKAPSFNAFEYRYEWQKGSDASWVTEPSGFDAYAYRVRYVGQTGYSTFKSNPWTMPTDTWTNNNVKTDQEKDPYTSATGVTRVSQNPISYNLSQNYPNPFNPSTTISFSIEKAGPVTLKIYNILGQEVVSLVNEELRAGSYTYKFEGSRLSSGVYFYSLNAGTFHQVKKMMLLK